MLCLILLSGFLLIMLFFFKQKTAYELRISDWSSDVCSSDLRGLLSMRTFLRATKDLPHPEERGRPGRPRVSKDTQCCCSVVVTVQPHVDPLGGRYYGAPPPLGARSSEIGRAWCRERVCQSV